MASVRWSNSNDREDKDLAGRKKETPICKMVQLLSQLGSTLLCNSPRYPGSKKGYEAKLWWNRPWNE